MCFTAMAFHLAFKKFELVDGFCETNFGKKN